MTQRCFILEGNGATANRGCQAIHLVTTSLLREAFNDCRFINAPAAVGDRSRNYPSDSNTVHLLPQTVVRWRPRWFARKLRRKLLGQTPEPSYRFARHLDQADAVLALGGDNYSLDYGRPDRFFDVIKRTRQARKPFVIWGASVGSFASDPEFEAFAVQQLQDVSLICVRESESIRYLASLGIEDNVVAVADPAFLLPPHESALSPTLEKSLEGPVLGLNLSGLMGRYRKNGEAWVEEAADWVKQLLRTIDMPLLLVPHVVHPRDDDHHFLAEVQRRAAVTDERLLLLPRDLDCRQIKGVIARLQAFIGARTHSTIAALSSCVPTLSIGYSLKSRGINLDIFGHTEHLAPIDQLDANSLATAAEGLLRNQSQIRRHLEATMPAYSNRARDSVQFLKEMLDSDPSGVPGELRLAAGSRS
ncbi:MAG: polysaccharide pyruvyl transferase family protein [Planctomycetales bacterium]|nr:polysaccharide pyruvyl transferase family protein [Planctomycetales bacterium]